VGLTVTVTGRLGETVTLAVTLTAGGRAHRVREDPSPSPEVFTVPPSLAGPVCGPPGPAAAHASDQEARNRDGGVACGSPSRSRRAAARARPRGRGAGRYYCTKLQHNGTVTGKSPAPASSTGNSRDSESENLPGLGTRNASHGGQESRPHPAGGPGPFKLEQLEGLRLEHFQIRT
jgi:hypothetical protein